MTSTLCQSNPTNLFFDTPAHCRQFIDEYFMKKIGRTSGATLARLASLIGNKTELEITNKHFLNCLGNLWTERTLIAATNKLVKLELINKQRTWVRDAQGRILSSKNTYSINWRKVWEMLTTTVLKKLQLPTVTNSSFSKEKENNVRNRTSNSFLINEKEQPAASSRRIEIKKDKPITKPWYQKAWGVGMQKDQIEKTYPEFMKYHSETRPSHRTPKQWTLAWVRWITKERDSMTKKEEVVKVDEFKIKSEMRYEIYQEKDEEIKELKLKLLEMVDPKTYRAWFSEIILEHCLDDGKFDFTFYSPNSFINDTLNADPIFFGRLRSLRIKPKQ